MNITLLLAFSFVTLANAKPLTDPTAEKISAATKSRIHATLLKAPLHFEANQGQTDEQVKFLARSSGYTLFLTSTEAVMVLKEREQKTHPGQMRSLSGLPNPKSKTRTELSRSIENPKSTVVRMKLVDGNPDAQVTGLEQLPGKVNYFIGNDPKKWRTNIPTYKRVEYKDVYPGVNLVFYGNQQQLEYDFVVSPGADPGAIKIAFEGADKIEMDSKGDLILRTGLGDLRLRKPLVYQVVNGVRKKIAGSYVLNPKSKIGNPKSEGVGFQVAAYDASKPLLIDPVIEYSTYLGGNTRDVLTGIAVDPLGNAYLAGGTKSLNFPIANALQPSIGGDGDVFVAKLSPDGSGLVYSTYLGGGAQDDQPFIAADSSGNAYVTGRTDSSNFPIMNAFQPFYGGGRDSFVTKLDPKGGLIYSSYIGGSGEEEGVAIRTDSLGNAYVAGITASTNFPTLNALQPTFGGGPWDSFVAKFDPVGGVIYSTYLGGSGDDQARAVTADSTGNAYVTGYTVSSDFPIQNALQNTSRGGFEAYLTKLNPDGSSIVFSTYFGGSGDDSIAGILVDASGNIYLAGGTRSTDFPTKNPFQANLRGIADQFVAKLTPDASSLVFSTYLGGSGDDGGRGLALDSSGNVFVSGDTNSTDFPMVNPIQPNNAGGLDIFVAKLNSNGSALLWSTYLGGSGLESHAGIGIDASNNVYVGIRTESTDIPTVNAIQPAHAGGEVDAFVAKITDVITVSIDIKPGSFPNSINLRNKGTVAVAVLGTPQFNVEDVAVNIVMFAGASPVRFSFEDVDLDGHVDLVFHFQIQALQLTSSSTEATLTGETIGGTPITGTDSVRIVP